MPFSLARLWAGVSSQQRASVQATPAKAQNPLRVDPTKTTLIRRQFASDVSRRFALFRSHLREFLQRRDVLALKRRHFLSFLAEIPAPGAYQFASDTQKVDAFKRWLEAQVSEDILGAGNVLWTAPVGSMASGPWTTPYVVRGYQRGLLNAFLSSPVGRKAEDEFIRDMITSHLEKIELLSLAAFGGIEGASRTMSTDLIRILSQGILEKRSLTDIAAEMAERIDIAENRALMVARTEIIHSHAEAQLDAFQEMGVEELGVLVEWQTAGDERVCSLCSDLDGKTFSVEEGRGVIPMHPNCRCSWVPVAAAQ